MIHFSDFWILVKYQRKKKLRKEGKLHSNDMSDTEKVMYLIDWKRKIEKEGIECLLNPERMKERNNVY